VEETRKLQRVVRRRLLRAVPAGLWHNPPARGVSESCPGTCACPPRWWRRQFLKANPGLEPDGITITCRAGHIQEARICLSKTLDPVPCGQDVVKDCRMKDALFTHMRNIP
jgi:Ribonuclease I